jgi:hypothetical protein
MLDNERHRHGLHGRTDNEPLPSYGDVLLDSAVHEQLRVNNVTGDASKQSAHEREHERHDAITRTTYE